MRQEIGLRELWTSETPVIWVIGLVLFAGLIGFLFYGRPCGKSRWRGLLLGLVAMLTTVAFAIPRWREFRAGSWSPGIAAEFPLELRATLPLLGIALFVFAILPLAMMLYRKWIFGEVSADENAPGRIGIRAWLSGRNLTLAVLIALGGWMGFNWSFFGTLALVVVALLIQPLIKTATQTTEPIASSAARLDELQNQRERVLKMIEAGRITAAESADLLSALGQSEPAAPQSTATPGRLHPRGSPLAMAGVALVAIAFFLPWFTIHTGTEMNRMLGEFRGLWMNSGLASPGTIPEGMLAGSIRVAGGDIRHGLGWLILIAGLGSALLPILDLRIDRKTQRLMSWGLLATGGFLLLYLFIPNLRFVSIGIFMALLGYVILALGLAEQRHA